MGVGATGLEGVAGRVVGRLQPGHEGAQGRVADRDGVQLGGGEHAGGAGATEHEQVAIRQRDHGVVGAGLVQGRGRGPGVSARVVQLGGGERGTVFIIPAGDEHLPGGQQDGGVLSAGLGHSGGGEGPSLARGIVQLGVTGGLLQNTLFIVAPCHEHPAVRQERGGMGVMAPIRLLVRGFRTDPIHDEGVVERGYQVDAGIVSSPREEDLAVREQRRGVVHGVDMYVARTSGDPRLGGDVVLLGGLKWAQPVVSHAYSSGDENPSGG